MVWIPEVDQGDLACDWLKSVAIEADLISSRIAKQQQ